VVPALIPRRHPAEPPDQRTDNGHTDGAPGWRSRVGKDRPPLDEVAQPSRYRQIPLRIGNQQWPPLRCQPKFTLKAAKALGKLPSVMSFCWAELKAKMLVHATLCDVIQAANWLTK
jgi:hypothetical protein